MDKEEKQNLVMKMMNDGFDVTANELENYSKNEYINEIIQILKETWCEGDTDREENIRIGTVKFFVDKNGFAHLDFVTRFKVVNKGPYASEEATRLSTE